MEGLGRVEVKGGWVGGMERSGVGLTDEVFFIGHRDYTRKSEFVTCSRPHLGHSKRYFCFCRKFTVLPYAVPRSLEICQELISLTS